MDRGGESTHIELCADRHDGDYRSPVQLGDQGLVGAGHGAQSVITSWNAGSG
jgi:hypothetical protein